MEQIDVVYSLLRASWFLLMFTIPFILFFLVINVFKRTFDDNDFSYRGSSSSSVKRNNYSSTINLNKSFVLDHREEKENKYSKGDSEMMKRVFKQKNSVSINQSGSNSYQREMAKKNAKRNSSSSSDNSNLLLGTALGVAVTSSYYSDSSSSSSCSSSSSYDSSSSCDSGGW
ncbi:hypothetical protein COD05_15985 [Bacillus cereus]|nr:hypothetical protein COD05_15985 [Bacillus cereus]